MEIFRGVELALALSYELLGHCVCSFIPFFLLDFEHSLLCVPALNPYSVLCLIVYYLWCVMFERFLSLLARK